MRKEPVYSSAIGAGVALFKSLRVKRTVFGAHNIPDEGGAVVAMTHFGYLEFALVEWATWSHNRRRIRFMAKKSVFDKAALGTVMRSMKHIPVDMKAGADAYAEAVKALRSGELLGVFPEAGVSASFTVRALKTGAARLAAEADVPIIPVAVWGGQRLLTKNHKPKWRERIGVPVFFSYGKPIRVSENDDVVEVTAQLQETMQHQLDRLQKQYPVDGFGQWWQPRHLGGTAPTPAEAAAADTERERRRETASHS